MVWFSHLCCNFALTSASLSEHPFQYDNFMGDSLKIWYTAMANCCCIRYHFLVRISLRVGTAGPYSIMKGKICLDLSIRCVLNVVIFSSDVLFEELALRKF